jgi:TRAP-type uncharacterized transport system substrate-binding protein
VQRTILSQIDMDSLPSGAQFVRARMLWEIALGIAGDPSIPYYGNRDISLVIGNGSGDEFTPSLRMAPGSPALARAVVRGELELAFVNPSAMLTQAYRGVGLYREPLPVRIIASYPSWDRFVVAVHPRLGIRSLKDLQTRRIPAAFSIREDATHSTRVLVDQLLGLYEFSLADAEAWGSTFQLNGPPGDRRRLTAIREGNVDIVFDEGIRGWMPTALENGLKVLELEPEIVGGLEALGWRRAKLGPADFAGLSREVQVVDYSGWPLYTREALPEDVAYRVCGAIAARREAIPWDPGSAMPSSLGDDTSTTPRDVPLHAGAERWYREHARASY